jgi:hypothetical protein
MTQHKSAERKRERICVEGSPTSMPSPPLCTAWLFCL